MTFNKRYDFFLFLVACIFNLFSFNYNYSRNEITNLCSLIDEPKTLFDFLSRHRIFTYINKLDDIPFRLYFHHTIFIHLYTYTCIHTCSSSIYTIIKYWRTKNCVGMVFFINKKMNFQFAIFNLTMFYYFYLLKLCWTFLSWLHT